MVLIVAYETTTNLIANVLRMVLTDPRFRARLSGGHMTVPEAVEQTLWDEPPFTSVLGRWAVGDTELGGQQIKAGDALIVGIAPANTDPAVRPDLSVSMEGNRAHLAFSSGPHECPGQDIGRAIADVGVDALLMRLPDLELAVDEEKLIWAGNFMSRHLVDLPASFAPSRAAGDRRRTAAGGGPVPGAAGWEVASPAAPRHPGGPPPPGRAHARAVRRRPGREPSSRRSAAGRRGSGVPSCGGGTATDPAARAGPGAPALRVRGDRAPGPVPSSSVKLTILGGGGFRVPLVYGALLGDHAEGRVSRVTLYDTDADRLTAVARVLADQAAGIARRARGRRHR